MKKVIGRYSFLICMLIALMSIIGCRTLDQIPFGGEIVHNELLTYDLPYDKTYMLVVEALSDVPGWNLAGTDIQKGKIYTHTTTFNFDEAAVILIKRIEARKTSVELSPESQTKKGVEDILKAIDLKLSKNF